MTKLIKYLKPFRLWVFFILILLLTQAMCELYLPNLMSGIVNVGIQQGGIKDSAPEAISPDAYELMLWFMPKDALILTETHYAAVSASDKDEKGKPFGSRYPGIGKSSYTGMDNMVYVRTSTEADTLERLNQSFNAAAYSFIKQLQDRAALTSSAALDMELASVLSADFDMNKIYRIFYALTDPSAVFSSAPEIKNEADLMMARQMGLLFAKAYYGELGLNMQSRYIWQTGLFMLLIALFAGLASIATAFFTPRLAAGVARDIRRDIFMKVENFSHIEFDRFSSASLITRCTNDVGQVSMLIGMGVRMLCFSPIIAIGGVIMAVNRSVSMSWIIALTVIVIIGAVIVLITITIPKFKIIQGLIDKLNKVSREILSGLMVIRAFGTQNHEKNRFESANQNLAQATLFVNRIMALTGPLLTLAMNGTTLLIIWVGANHIANSELLIGDMMAFMQYAMQIIISFMLISMVLGMVPRAAVSAARIAEVLETKMMIADPEDPELFDETKKGLIEFNNVRFRYNGAEEDAVEGISFTASPGKTTAIIGATGAGKSTIANLLLRFYDVTEGRISVGGMDIRKVRQAELRDRIGYVPQKGQLLTGTIASNIRYGRQEATDDEVREAAETAQAMDFIIEKPEGIASEISQGGANVSGGQKQRLSIARALAKKPDILVFDDSFSALDFKTDAALRKALKVHTADATVIMIAQRVGTIMNAEQILVLDEGKIVGRGTHDELLKTCPAYYETASSQLAERLEETGILSKNPQHMDLLEEGGGMNG